MVKATKRCAFCDAMATAKGEHLWDDWLNDELPKTRFSAKKRLSLDSTPIKFTTVGLKEKVPAVCEKCNSGWMSSLTAKVKERFSKAILEGEPFSLDTRDTALLAAYIFLKAAVKDYCYGIDVFFTRAARERLRNSLTIPPLVKMWIAAYQGSSRFAFHSNFNIVSTSAPGPLYGMEFFCYTYVVGNLAAQLIAPRWKDIRDGGNPLVTLVPNAYWDSATIQFWPDPGRNLSWPPQKYLGDSVFEQFLYRFKVPVMIPLR